MLLKPYLCSSMEEHDPIQRPYPDCDIFFTRQNLQILQNKVWKYFLHLGYFNKYKYFTSAFLPLS